MEGRGRLESRGAVALVYACTITTLAFSNSEFLQPFIGFSNIGLVFLIRWFSPIFFRNVWFSHPTLLVYSRSVSLPFCGFPSPLSPLWLLPLSVIFFSSLVVFPHPFRFFRLPRGCSHIVLFTHFCVVFHTLVLNKSVVFGALFCF